MTSFFLLLISYTRSDCDLVDLNSSSQDFKKGSNRLSYLRTKKARERERWEETQMRTYLVMTTIDFDFSQVIFGPYVFAKATTTHSALCTLGKNYEAVNSISKSNMFFVDYKIG